MFYRILHKSVEKYGKVREEMYLYLHLMTHWADMMKRTLARQLSINRFCSEHHENTKKKKIIFDGTRVTDWRIDGHGLRLRHSDFRRVRKICEKRLLALSCLSVCTEQLSSHWADFFYEIWYFNIFRQSAEKIQVWLKSGKNRWILYTNTYVHLTLKSPN